MSLYEGKSLVEWSEEYVNSLKVLRSYIEELKQKSPVSPQEYSRYNLLIECQRILAETSKSCIRLMLKENMFNVSELSDSFVLLEPYLFNTKAGRSKKA